MIRFVADENFRRAIVKGVLRVDPRIDVVRVQDVGIGGSDDPALLEWAAQHRRALLTHDETTMIDFAYERISAGKAKPGDFFVAAEAVVAAAIDSIVLVATCSQAKEWEWRVQFLPF